MWPPGGRETPGHAKDLGGRAVAQDVLPDRPGNLHLGLPGDRRPGPLADRDDAARIREQVVGPVRAGASREEDRAIALLDEPDRTTRGSPLTRPRVSSRA